jgi:hypothetical protein
MKHLVDARDDRRVYEEYQPVLADRIAVVAEISSTRKDLGPTSFEGLYPFRGYIPPF